MVSRETGKRFETIIKRDTELLLCRQSLAFSRAYGPVGLVQVGFALTRSFSKTAGEPNTYNRFNLTARSSIRPESAKTLSARTGMGRAERRICYC
ncbi:hypothetical protein KIM372_01390 [Bombiscardovia nodaiensis]|uniref:Uncharacterized protein n=1 Tax=Bombiscardovia nodaiensis TaxID=2932181 RepID=A0ABN6SAX3_9BIFI|nr:hypothetical protein KIM372_01390 [Bombiscardovia nodaiensis]